MTRDKAKLRFASGLGGIIAVAVVLFCRSDARASVAFAVTFDALLADSAMAGVFVPLGRRAVWEDGRICTYTEARADRSIAGSLASGQHVWIRTLGGVVGDVGQRVEGEAVLLPGESSLLFLREGPPGGAFDVTARGQGQYPIVADQFGKLARVVRSNAMGMVVPRPAPFPVVHRLAGEVLHDRNLDDVAREIASAWARPHAP
jgi:hypothetical protein